MQFECHPVYPFSSSTQNNPYSGRMLGSLYRLHTNKKLPQKRRPSTAKKEDPKQYEKETVETGKVNLSVYTFYIRNMGMLLFGSSIIFFILSEVLNTSSKVWLSLWTDEENLRSIA